MTRLPDDDGQEWRAGPPEANGRDHSGLRETPVRRVAASARGGLSGQVRRVERERHRFRGRRDRVPGRAPAGQASSPVPRAARDRGKRAARDRVSPSRCPGGARSTARCTGRDCWRTTPGRPLPWRSTRAGACWPWRRASRSGRRTTPKEWTARPQARSRRSWRTGEFLRDHLTAGRFWSLLPIVHFLKKISSDLSERPQARRACFVIDDPNLRFSSYGYVSFPELGEGRTSIRLPRCHRDDSARPPVARTRCRERLSELSIGALARRARERPRAPRVGALPQCGRSRANGLVCGGSCGQVRGAVRDPRRSRDVPATRRVQPRDAGGALPVRVSRARGIPALPVGAGSPTSAGGVSEDGCRPSSQAGAPGDPALSAEPQSGRPGVSALLGQPLILYCHHADLRDGLEPLRAAAARVAELGDVRWMSLASIAQGERALPRAGRSRDRDDSTLAMCAYLGPRSPPCVWRYRVFSGRVTG